MPIESGPTGERKVRSLLLFLMVFAFSGWFAYDGWIGYPAENRKEHLEQLPTESRAGAENFRIYESVNETTTRDLIGKVKKHKDNLGAVRADLAKFYGGPPSFETADSIYYCGPSYRVIVAVEMGKDNERRILGRATEKSATSILWQKGLSVLLLAFALYLLALVVQVRRTRLVLDQAGLSYCGIGPIGWDSMRSMEISGFSRKGYVDLLYDDHGVERKLRLDEYHIEKFDDVIDELCARKGFENPLPVVEEPAPQT
jgi:hypothetical protein